MQDRKAIKIVIVGSGLGGLIAALCLSRDGHNVQLFERRQTFEPKGGGILIRPNASRFLKQWGLEADMNTICDNSPATAYRDAKEDQIEMRRVAVTNFEGLPDWGTFREDAQRVFYKHATANGATITFGVAVEDVSEDDKNAYLRLSTGETVQADLILVADGILSKLRPKIVPGAPSPVPGYSTIYQIRVPEETMLKDPRAKTLATDGTLLVFMKKDGGGYVVSKCYKALGRMSGVYGIPERDDDPRLFDENGDINYVREYFKDYAPVLTSFLKLADRCDRWRVAEMPNLPSWTSTRGRIALLGDSAHAMLPDAAQALTTAWQDVRKPRVERIKDWARFNHELYTKGTKAMRQGGSSDKQFGGEVSLDDVELSGEASFRSPAFLKWAFGFDVIAEVERHVRAMEKGKL